MKRGDIIDYTIPGHTDPVLNNVVSANEIVPMIVVTTDDVNQSYSGLAFLPDGSTRYVTYSYGPVVVLPGATPKFDPETGKPFGQESWNFDPVTGKSFGQEVPLYDTQTGDMLGDTPIADTIPNASEVK